MTADRRRHPATAAAGAAPEQGAPAATRTLRAIGTTAVVAVTNRTAADDALGILAAELAAIDFACSRFREDSEIQEVHRAAGRPVRVSTLLFGAVAVALAVAERTAGAVDPTVGAAVCRWGYDRDFEQVPARLRPDAAAAVGTWGAPGLPARRARQGGERRGGPGGLRLHPAGTGVGATGPRPSATAPAALPAGWWQVELDHRARTVSVPRGTVLDLGATAKALVADRAAARIAEATGSGVLVSVGGDVAVAGAAPDDGWAVGIAPTSSSPLHAIEQVVALHTGGLASSSPAVRSWVHGGVPVHHIIDPATGTPASRHWRLVSAAGASCVEANAATTAAVVWGPDAPDRLAALGAPARLVAADGAVVTVNGWPDPESGPDAGHAGPHVGARPGPRALGPTGAAATAGPTRAGWPPATGNRPRRPAGTSRAHRGDGR